MLLRLRILSFICYLGTAAIFIYIIYPKNKVLDSGDQLAETILNKLLKEDDESTSEDEYPDKCYQSRIQADKVIKSLLLDDIMDDTIKLYKRGYFYFETSCSKTGLLKLSEMQACTIESVALQNPGAHIFVLFASPRFHLYDLDSNSPLAALQYYPNIHFYNVNLWRFIQGTQAAKWFESGPLFESEHLSLHIQQFLNFLLATKLEGSVILNNLIALKSFKNLPRHYIAPLHLGIMNIRKNLANLLLNEFITNFDESTYNPNQSMEIVLKKLCEIESFDDSDFIKVRHRQCGKSAERFNVIPSELFYPIGEDEAGNLYDPQKNNEVLNITSTDAYLINCWSDKIGAIFNSKYHLTTPYALLAQKYCPKTYQILHDNISN